MSGYRPAGRVGGHPAGRRRLVGQGNDGSLLAFDLSTRERTVLLDAR